MTSRAIAIAAAVVAVAPACRDVTRYSTAADESYCGSIVRGAFVRAGLGEDTRMRLVFDADRIADRPGAVWTSDGLFAGAPLRPIPQVWDDPLSTLQFGEGRDRNLLYAVDPTTPDRGPTILVVLSLLHDGAAEARLVRGAPPVPGGNAIPATNGQPVFGVFPLRREKGTCGLRP